MESNPDNFFRNLYPAMWEKCRERVSEFVGSNPQNLVFVETATSACNAVVKSIELGPGDAILVNSWTYGAMRNICKSAVDRVGAQLANIDIKWPISSQEEIVAKYDEFFAKNTNIKIAVIDHISSPTATLFPIEELIKVCHKHNVLSYIDGAHGPGQLSLRLDELGADFYGGNLHKWMFTPKGCAILWVHPKHHRKVHPAMTSTLLCCDPWTLDFMRQATRNYTPYLATPEAMRFYEDIGGMETIKKHNCTLLDEAVDMLIKALGSKKPPIPKDMEAPFMRLVGVPPLKKHPPGEGAYGDLRPLMLDLLQRFNVATAILYVQGEAWIRLSGQVYNSIDDYRKLRDALLVIIREDDEHP